MNTLRSYNEGLQKLKQQNVLKKLGNEKKKKWKFNEHLNQKLQKKN